MLTHTQTHTQHTHTHTYTHTHTHAHAQAYVCANMHPCKLVATYKAQIYAYIYEFSYIRVHSSYGNMAIHLICACLF